MAMSRVGLLLAQMDEVSGRLRGRLEGLGDEEYFWEPVPGCWTVRRDPSGAGGADYTPGGGGPGRGGRPPAAGRGGPRGGVSPPAARGAPGSPPPRGPPLRPGARRSGRAVVGVA